VSGRSAGVGEGGNIHARCFLARDRSIDIHYANDSTKSGNPKDITTWMICHIIYPHHVHA